MPRASTSFAFCTEFRLNDFSVSIPGPGFLKIILVLHLDGDSEDDFIPLIAGRGFLERGLVVHRGGVIESDRN